MIKSLRKINELNEISSLHPGVPDDLFVCFASFEERCLGVVHRFSDYNCKHAIIFRIGDEPSKAREKHCKKLKDRLSHFGTTVNVIETKHKDPVVGMQKFLYDLKKVCPDYTRAVITVDISTFTKKQLLLFLRTLDKAGLLDSVRLLYTEPKYYAA